MKRGVGYCENTDCEDYAKGVFLLNHGDTFYCPRCRAIGHLVSERGSYTGTHPFFNEVRVEFNYEPTTHRYCEIAIVRDESLPPGNTYTLQSPLIRTEKRALKVAEAVLSNLNRFGILQDEIPGTGETTMSFDASLEEFVGQCKQLRKDLEQSYLTRRPSA